MYNVYLHPKESDNPQFLSYDEFKNLFVDICTQHKNERRALAFAFILYDIDNPEISEILTRNDYWNALNKISGTYLTIFSLHNKEYPGFGLLDMLDEPTFKLLEPHFDKSTYETLPSILFFQVTDNKVIDSFYVKLRNERVEKSFLEIKKYIKSAVEALQKIDEENYQNHIEIFQQLKNNVKSIESILNFNEVIKKIKPVKEIFSIFFG
ncbi:hypothetical protein A2V82_02205 [candidate division KSB1 bacterium RBG_16_48_16]|nr:MAG: hypothetical protein A2V82_02205 [candidate division KSB1 bacterium RBG_16_48_16]